MFIKNSTLFRKKPQVFLKTAIPAILSNYRTLLEKRNIIYLTRNIRRHVKKVLFA